MTKQFIILGIILLTSSWHNSFSQKNNVQIGLETYLDSETVFSPKISYERQLGKHFSFDFAADYSFNVEADKYYLSHNRDESYPLYYEGYMNFITLTPKFNYYFGMSDNRFYTSLAPLVKWIKNDVTVYNDNFSRPEDHKLFLTATDNALGVQAGVGYQFNNEKVIVDPHITYTLDSWSKFLGIGLDIGLPF